MITKTKKNIVTEKEVTCPTTRPRQKDIVGLANGMAGLAFRREREGWASYNHQKEPHFKDVNEFFEKVKEYGNENKHRFMLCGKCLGVFVDYKPPVCSCGNFHGQKFREITGAMRKQLQAGHKIEKIMAHWII